MNKICIILALLLSFLSPMAATAGEPTEVDVLYMNHGPLMSTIANLKGLFARYGEKVSAQWYDFESEEGVKFMAAKGINSHVPLMIWINGENTVQLDGAPSTFIGFPSGSGPDFFQGAWTLESLGRALDQATQKN
jgi:hypothetical protein